MLYVLRNKARMCIAEFKDDEIIAAQKYRKNRQKEIGNNDNLSVMKKIPAGYMPLANW